MWRCCRRPSHGKGSGGLRLRPAVADLPVGTSGKPSLRGRGGRRAPPVEHRQNLFGVKPQRLLGERIGGAAEAERGAQLELADRGPPRFQLAQDPVRRPPHGGFQERLDDAGALACSRPVLAATATPR